MQCVGLLVHTRLVVAYSFDYRLCSMLFTSSAFEDIFAVDGFTGIWLEGGSGRFHFDVYDRKIDLSSSGNSTT